MSKDNKALQPLYATPQPMPMPNHNEQALDMVGCLTCGGTTRSEKEIVDQTEWVAAILAGRFYGLETGGLYRESSHPLAQRCWAVACQIQSEITATDVENALAEIEADSMDADISKPPPSVSALAEALESLIKAYVRLLEVGRNRITSLGGQCDPVDFMERADPYLRDARAALVTCRNQGGAR